MEKDDNLDFCDNLKRQLNSSLNNQANKVAVRILGGLGRQMFQYAFARSYALKHSKNLYLDISGCSPQGKGKRPYLLEVFNIHPRFIGSEEARKWKIKRHLPGFLRKLAGIKLYDEGMRFPYNAKLAENPGYAYLCGRFATEKYFMDYENIIREDFQIKCPPSPENAKIIEKITKENSVGIHVRCKPYAYTKNLYEVRGLCSFDYYMSAINYIAKRIEKPVFYIFSDDPEWIRENFKIAYPTNIIDWNDESKGFEDLRLMSLCKHNIMANSFFSWWAAWLNNNKRKIIIAPEKWFYGDELNIKDLIPENWIKM